LPWVRGYVRSDGTPVRGYSRWASGARREMGILAGVALAVVVLGNSGAASGSGTGPQPTVRYPIKFDTPTSKVTRPQPTVSYPIPWVRKDGAR
jgi:hypothetical protein